MTPQEQQTIAGPGELKGKGLHTGAEMRVTFRPAPPDRGIVFRRVDLDGQPEVSATVEHVAGVERETVLASGEARVRTVEHVLAAVISQGIDNIIIEMEGEEPPAGDGSAADFVGLLRRVGLEGQGGRSSTWSCSAPFTVVEGASRYAVLPDERYVISSAIDYSHPLIGRQSASYVIEPGSFAREVAPARTFGFFEDARAIAARAGGDGSGPVLDINQILEILPHRFPFLLVDRVISYEKGKRIVGIKNVTIDEPFFVGHFPGLPIMPGVLIIEAMAQVGGLLLMDVVEDRENKVVYFMSLDNVKFRRPVTPGDQVEFELELVQLRNTTCRMKGVGRVDGHVVAEAEMMARVMDR
jgi:beta-hydroxyacyl-ACP dehydratase FabZ